MGLLLFILYVNDITRMVLDCKISLYADDTVIFYHGVDTEIIEYNLQSDLTRISNWLLANKLSIDVKKCKIMLASMPQHRERL